MYALIKHEMSMKLTCKKCSSGMSTSKVGKFITIKNYNSYFGPNSYLHIMICGNTIPSQGPLKITKSCHSTVMSANTYMSKLTE